MTLVMRGHDNGQRVKINETIQTPVRKSSWVMHSSGAIDEAKISQRERSGRKFLSRRPRPRRPAKNGRDCHDRGDQDRAHNNLNAESI